MTAADPHRAVEAVWRIESARVIAALARMVNDVALAEELAQDALVAALEEWPRKGVPDNRIAALYRLLAHLTPSPIVELNRAVAVGMAHGPERGLEIADGLRNERALRDYAHLPAVRGHLLAELGRAGKAAAAFRQAAALTRNERERDLFLKRATELSA
ncbi:hypothetical protein [Nonomuraea lactucae]|uniref:hypothetical protein n=1 Tax=Nonomuraea lactucae TaxID=2249762 RepID=UPI001966C634|nr:hypothetical protein [Nonomuraea lactucae]